MFEPRQYQVTTETGQEFYIRNQLVNDFGRETKRVYDKLRIVFVESGRITWVIDAKGYDVREGDFVILNNTESRYQCDPDTKTPFIQQVIEFLPTFAYPCLNCLTPFYHKRDADFSNVICSDSPQYDMIYACYLRLLAEAFTEYAYKNEAIRGAFLSLLVGLSRAYPTYENKDSRAADCRSLSNFNTICAAVRYIKDNLGDELNLTRLAERFGLSPAYFSRMFSSIWGMSVTGYIRSQRVNATLERLKGGNQNVLEAAMECGFTSSSGFYKAFRDVMGAPPRRATDIFP